MLVWVFFSALGYIITQGANTTASVNYIHRLITIWVLLTPSVIKLSFSVKIAQS